MDRTLYNVNLTVAGLGSAFISLNEEVNLHYPGEM